MYPWLHMGPYAISTYSLMFLCAYIVGGLITYYEAKRQHRATEAILHDSLSYRRYHRWLAYRAHPPGKSLTRLPLDGRG